LKEPKELISVTALPESPVVVGLDGTPASAAALAWAATEARAYRAPLVVVHVLDPRGRTAAYSPSTPADRDNDGALSRIKELIDRTETGPVEQVFEIGVPALVLAQRAHGARLLVLGHAAGHHLADGEEFRPGPVLGPIARACIARAECPVVVVPEPVTGRTAPVRSVPRHRDPVRGGRAIYPFQGRIPVAHQ
jgi:nucleotide-binding universal stress UspA family protein